MHSYTLATIFTTKSCTVISNIANINAKLTDVQPGSVNIRVQPACQATGEGLGHAPFRVRDAARERIFSARERIDRAPSLGMP